MNNSIFVYGSELQGRGYVTSTDLIFGIMTTTAGVIAFGSAVVDLYMIKTLKAFHNAFGFFWATRSSAEMFMDVTFALYTGPVTILQSANMNPYVSIAVYHYAFTFAYLQCVMNLVIAVNRFVAVCFPLKYIGFFKKKICWFVAIFGICQSISIPILYIIFPCQNIAYGPRFYANVFPKCSGDMERDYSLLAYVLVKACFIIACSGTAVINFTTFCKIGHVRFTSKVRYQSEEFRRDVRLFVLGVSQDILMMIVVFMILLCNTKTDLSILGALLSYDGLIFIYIFNTVSMVMFNPEWRRTISLIMKFICFLLFFSVVIAQDSFTPSPFEWGTPGSNDQWATPDSNDQWATPVSNDQWATSGWNSWNQWSTPDWGSFQGATSGWNPYQWATPDYWNPSSGPFYGYYATSGYGGPYGSASSPSPFKK
ncbi:hypothetical protein QR680_015480 [Steinernema hermaphroditum]|uniref:7TM GPCR serpentine receptor class x (Srx) domain-containing protein n=1 Tax=Steinernema hermaphroditum TaxID=289476 RepID=A0AA39H842_9BILA|nr:hypothetical protein QR680_015480 [Steinernema hermaphroditum]